MRAVDRVVQALAARGGAVSSWLVGGPCVPPPQVLREALSEAAQQPSYGYPPASGLPRLREILAASLGGAGTNVNADQVVVTHGAKGGLLALFAALLRPDDEVIHPVPFYPAYPAIAAKLGARSVAVPERDGSFEGWIEMVSKRIGKRTKAIVVASPSNPTGATFDSGQAGRLVDLCRERGVRLICDEAYVDFRYSKNGTLLPADLDPARETVVQVRSASKSWALCGWRIGWVVADAPFASRVASTHASLMNPASGPAQVALLALPQVPNDYLDFARVTVKRRIDVLCAGLNDSGVQVHQPEGGFYLWLDVRRHLKGEGSAREWCVDLAARQGIGLWPGDDFGGTNRVRLAVTAPEDGEWDRSLSALLHAF